MFGWHVLYRFGLAFAMLLLLITAASAAPGDTPTVNSTGGESLSAPADTLDAADESMLDTGLPSDGSWGGCEAGY